VNTRAYREDGYFPEAFVNLLALLGWNAGNDQEFFTMQELIDSFDLSRVVKSGARFDPEKAKWFNRHYLQQKSDAELASLFMPILNEKGVGADVTKVEAIVALIKDRCEFVSELWDQGNFFFVAPESYDEKTIQKKWKPDTNEKLQEIAAFLGTLTDWKAEVIKEKFSAFMEAKEWSFWRCYGSNPSGVGRGQFGARFVCHP
jgi:glutamyl-tRNA synthetase